MGQSLRLEVVQCHKIEPEPLQEAVEFGARLQVSVVQQPGQLTLIGPPFPSRNGLHAAMLKQERQDAAHLDSVHADALPSTLANSRSEEINCKRMANPSCT